MATTTKSATKPSRRPAQTKTTEPAASATSKPRKLQKPSYSSFRLHKRIAAGPRLPGFFRLFKQAATMLVRNWRVFLGLTVVYGLLNAALVQGFSASNIGGAKSAMDQLFAGSMGHLLSSTGLFVYLLGASGNTANATAGTYQLLLILLFSVVLVWALRQVYAGNTISVRDALYRGATPLIPFVLVLAAVLLQMLPLGLGASIYSVITTNGLAVTGIEQLLWAVLFVVASLLSLYMVASSIFALYIVMLPDMTPMRALRSARQLVRGRRFGILRRIVLLPIALVLLAAVLIVPLILFVTPVAPWAFFVVTMFLLPIFHAYMYTLYRALL